VEPTGSATVVHVDVAGQSMKLLTTERLHVHARDAITVMKPDVLIVDVAAAGSEQLMFTASVVGIPLDPPVTRTVGLIQRAGRTLSPAAAAFAKLLVEASRARQHRRRR
jgi:hypothetical protein